MAKVRYLYNNLIDGSGVTITPSSESSTLTAANLTKELKTKVWRTGSSGAIEAVIFDFGDVVSISSFVLFAHTLTTGDAAAGAFVIQGNATDSWGAPSFNQVLTYNAEQIVAFFSSQSYRYWRFAFTKSASGETRDVGRIFLGTYYEVTQNPTPTGFAIAKKDPSKEIKSIGGQSYTEIRPQYDIVTLNYSLIPQAQANNFETVTDTVGIFKPFFISVDHDNQQYTWFWYVKFKTLPSISGNAVGTTVSYATTHSLEEQL